MKKLPLIAIPFLLAACGDEVTEVTNIYQSGLEVVDSVKDLPKCNDENEGQQAWVKGETSVRICSDGEWFALSSGDVSSGDLSCKTEELKDGSGLKIVCNGDSIGVVLNGSDGKDGKDGSGCSITEKTDSSMTVVCGDSTMVIELGTGATENTQSSSGTDTAITLDSLYGYVQKGPFVTGSRIVLEELDEQTLLQTGKTYQGVVKNDSGYFKISDISLANPYVALEATGFYRNEISGSKSSAAITLNAITNTKNRTFANVNIATHLEVNRVRYLVSKMNMTVEQAKQRAQNEIFKLVGVDATGFFSSENLNIMGRSDEDRALLVLSVLLLGDRDVASLSALLANIAMDIEEDGTWDDSTARLAVAEWCAMADSVGMQTTIRNNMENMGYSGTMPDLQAYMRNFWTRGYGLDSCNNGNVGKVMAATAGKNAGSKIRYICRNKGENTFDWDYATDQEKDTYGWGTGYVGQIKTGDVTGKKYMFSKNQWIDESKWVCVHGSRRYDTTLTAIYTSVCEDNAWTARAPGFCTPGTAAKIQGAYYACEGEQWTPISQWLYVNTVDYPCFEDGDIVAGLVDSSTYFLCSANRWRPMGEKQECLDDIEEEIRMFDNTFFKCILDKWIRLEDIPSSGSKVGLMRDADGQKYETFVVGGMQWMIQNLNYETENSFCYNDDTSSCTQSGRLYTWEAALAACPDGWHLPSSFEWKLLGLTENSVTLKPYMVFGLPAGYRDVDGSYKDEYDVSFFWTATESGSGAYYAIYSEENGYSLNVADKNIAYAVRCVQNN